MIPAPFLSERYLRAYKLPVAGSELRKAAWNAVANGLVGMRGLIFANILTALQTDTFLTDPIAWLRAVGLPTDLCDEISNLFGTCTVTNGALVSTSFGRGDVVILEASDFKKMDSYLRSYLESARSLRGALVVYRDKFTAFRSGEAATTHVKGSLEALDSICLVFAGIVRAIAKMRLEAADVKEVGYAGVVPPILESMRDALNKM